MKRLRLIMPLVLIAALFICSAATYGNLLGVDVSAYQGTINWDTLKASTNFAIMRASLSASSRDSQLTRNQSEARRVGMRHGYYHFAYPQYNTSIAEANWFVSQVGSVQPGELLVLDYEQQLGNQVNWCGDFLDRVYALTGVKPLIYLNGSTVNAYDWSRVRNAGYPLWIAYWDGSTNPAVPSNQWGFNTIKQYSDSGSVGGISPIDLDVSNGDPFVTDAAGPAVCKMNANRLDEVIRGTNSHVYIKTWTSAGGWAAPVDLGGNTVSSPAVVSRYDGCLDVFERCADNNMLYQKTYANGVWGNWVSLGGSLLSGPSVCSQNANHWYLVYRNVDNQIWYLQWNNGTYTYGAIPSSTYDDPAIVARGDGVMCLFERCTDNQLYQKNCTNGVWGNWVCLGGTLTSAPAVASRSATNLEIVYRGPNYDLFYLRWNNGVWTYGDLGGPQIAAKPAICCLTSDTATVYVRTLSNNQYLMGYYASLGWTGYTNQGPYYP